MDKTPASLAVGQPCRQTGHQPDQQIDNPQLDPPNLAGSLTKWVLMVRAHRLDQCQIDQILLDQPRDVHPKGLVMSRAQASDSLNNARIKPAASG